MLRLLKKIGFLCIPFVAVMAATNYFVDPGNYFSGKSIPVVVADIILSGKCVSWVQSFDNRLMQKYVILGMKTTPEVVVFGSSRARRISSQL